MNPASMLVRALRPLALATLLLPMVGSLAQAGEPADLAQIHGRIQFVTSFPDYKVKIVSSFPDLKVKRVSSFPSSCGKWKFVKSFPDFKIKYVSSFPDFKIKFVSSFPGVR